MSSARYIWPGWPSIYLGLASGILIAGSPIESLNVLVCWIFTYWCMGLDIWARLGTHPPLDLTWLIVRDCSQLLWLLMDRLLGSWIRKPRKLRVHINSVLRRTWITPRIWCLRVLRLPRHRLLSWSSFGHGSELWIVYLLVAMSTSIVLPYIWCVFCLDLTCFTDLISFEKVLISFLLLLVK